MASSGLQVDLLNAEKAALTNQADHKMLMLQEKKMELCEICGSFLVSDDVLERTQSHLTGKQHIGYGLVRDFLAECKVKSLLQNYWYNFNLLSTKGTLLLSRRQKKKRGLQGRRNQRSAGNRGKKSTIMGEGRVVPKERNLGSVTMNVIFTLNEAVKETDHTIIEREDHSIGAVPTEMVGILKETDTNIGVAI
jgi:hypothetical protein